MAEPLKEMFNAAYYARLAQEVERAWPGFKRAAFLKAVQQGHAARELNARMRHTSVTLRDHLPADPRAAVDILKAVVRAMPRGYTTLVFPDFVGLYLLDDPVFALDALKYFTPFGSSEFAVRAFIRRDVKGTLRVMRKWADDADEHVRRLASEGSRPRLPWSFRLEAIDREPALTKPILDRLQDDPALYVRKSVANHLNDFSKSDPTHVLRTLRGWDLRKPHSAWIAKHACRTLIKAGDPATLALFAFDSAVQVEVEALNVAPAVIRLGDTITLSFQLRSTAAKAQRLVVDYAIHYPKASGSITRKVFKLKEVELPANGRMELVKRQRMVDFSTRKHHPGEHRVELLVNGNVMATGAFVLQA